MWRYMVKEKKLQKMKDEPDTRNLRTSNRVTSTTTRNRITTIGSDVVALFPSLTAKETGEDCESQVLKSPLRIEGGNYKEMARYCTGNRKLAGNLDEIKHLLPWRRKSGKGGKEPGMQNPEMKGRKSGGENTWSKVKRRKQQERCRMNRGMRRNQPQQREPVTRSVNVGANS